MEQGVLSYEPLTAADGPAGTRPCRPLVTKTPSKHPAQLPAAVAPRQVPRIIVKLNTGGAVRIIDRKTGCADGRTFDFCQC